MNLVPTLFYAGNTWQEVKLINSWPSISVLEKEKPVARETPPTPQYKQFRLGDANPR